MSKMIDKQVLTEKKLELAIRWLNDIKGIGSATSIMATAALIEIDSLDDQFPLGVKEETEE